MRRRRHAFCAKPARPRGLDHPNICTVYEVDEADGQPFIVMAYLEGETVQSKIESSPLAVKERPPIFL